MDRKIDRNIARWVIALLVVGIIVGLVFLYGYIDSGNIDIGNIFGINKDSVKVDGNNTDKNNSGNNNGGGNVTGGNDEKDPNEENVNPKRTIPRSASSGVLEIGGDGNDVAVGVVDFMKGKIIVALSESTDEDFVGDGYRNVALAYLEGEGIVSSLMLEENEDVDYIGSNVNEYGLVVVGKGKSDVILYQINYSFKFVERRVIENVEGNDVKLFEDAYNSNLSIVYRKNNRTYARVYDTDLNSNHIVDIDSYSTIKGVFQRKGGGMIIATESGTLIESDYNGISKRDVSITIEEMAVVALHGKSGYAVIGVSGGRKRLAVFDMAFIKTFETDTDGDKMIVADTLYVLNSSDGIITRHCTCGEVVQNYETDIADVIYLNYLSRSVVYKTSDGKNKIAYFDKGIVKTEESPEAYVFISEEMSISNNGEIKVTFVGK